LKKALIIFILVDLILWNSRKSRKNCYFICTKWNLRKKRMVKHFITDSSMWESKKIISYLQNLCIQCKLHI